MLASFTKELGLVYCCIYCYYHFLNQFPKNSKLKHITFLILASLEGIFINQYLPQYTFICLIITICCFLTIQTKNDIFISFTTTTLAFGLSFLTFVISSFIVTCIFFLFTSDYRNPIVQLVSIILQLLLIQIPFSFKRTKKGMPFLIYPSYAFPGAILSLIILLFATLVNITSKTVLFLIPVGLLYLTIILFYIYWRNSLTKTYIDKLNTKNIENLNITLQEQQLKIQQLEAENERLARIIHKDNKLIPSMQNAVQTYLQSVSENAKIKQTGLDLITELNQLSYERKGLLTNSGENLEELQKCGILRIDNLLLYMQKKAWNDNIHLTVSYSCDMKMLITQIIDENTLHTMLADLIENAIIATKHNHGHHIMLSIDVISNSYAINLLDSGTPFSKDVLMQFGKEAITTHADESGSGIGLMELYQTLTKHRASLYIDELCDTGLYTKKISVVFNKANNIVLYTYRLPSEISELTKRGDFVIVYK